MEKKDFYSRLTLINDAFHDSLAEAQNSASLSPEFSELCISIENALIDKDFSAQECRTTRIAIKPDSQVSDRTTFEIGLADESPKELVLNITYSESQELLKKVVAFFDSLQSFSACMDCYGNSNSAGFYIKV